MRLSHGVGATIAVAALLVSAGAQAQQQFNGSWSVEVITEQGQCDKAYRFPVVIEGGQARYGGSGGFNANGSVSPNGAVTASISRGQIQADIKGRLAGTAGSGTWAMAGSRACSGRWVGEKRS